jgi:3' terminal RNA ribose 2'-O-methyltransferase Hen1
VQGLHEQRLAAVLAAVREAGAHSLVDLGCGEGRLLALALQERSLTRIFGMDVSSVALARARRRLHYDTLPPAQRARLELAQGSLLYRDTRLEGFDTAALVEVIEHLDPPRLEALERVVFAHARPRRVVVTTPNREYNIHWAAVGETRLRHGDHRFEWTRAECAAWAERIAAAHGYRATRQDLGPTDPDLGAPSQLVIFDRLKHSSDLAATAELG